MSVTHRPKTEAEKKLDAMRASIVQELKQEIAQEIEEREANIFESIRNNLVSVPEAGAEWDERKNYISGDTVTEAGVLYVATRYSRGKKPSENPDRWQIVQDEAEVGAWADIADGSIVEEGTIVTHNGKTWVCIAQHFKSSVYSPRAVSTKWREVE